MLRYDVAPGIQITYNNLNIDSCYSPIIFEQGFLQIDHCLEGCYECELLKGTARFISLQTRSGISGAGRMEVCFMGISRYNSEGYSDPTSHAALLGIRKEERAVKRAIGMFMGMATKIKKAEKQDMPIRYFTENCEEVG